MKKITRHLHVIFGLVFLGAALALWLWPKKQHPSPLRQHITTIEVANVNQTTTTRTIRFSGITRPAQRAVMAFSIPGRLIKRPVEVGSRVKKGLEVARIDVRQYENMVHMAQATVAELNVRAAQAGRDSQRIQKLADAGVATVEQLEQATAAVDAVNASFSVANSHLNEARRVLSEARLKAPFAGTVTAVFLEPGEYVSPGRPVVELSGDGEIELQVEVPENMVMALTEGESIHVNLPMAGGKQVEGQIKSLARAAAAPGGLFPVVATLEPVPGLSAGMTAELILEIKSEGELTVPVASILNPGSSGPYVFCLEKEIVRRVPVTLGSFSGDRIVVRGDVSSGDRVVVSGHTMLADGQRVKVAL